MNCTYQLYLQISFFFFVEVREGTDNNKVAEAEENETDNGMIAKLSVLTVCKYVPKPPPWVPEVIVSCLEKGNYAAKPRPEPRGAERKK